MNKSEKSVAAHAAALSIISELPIEAKEYAFSEDGWGEGQLRSALLSPTAAATASVYTAHHLYLLWRGASKGDRVLLEAAAMECSHGLKLTDGMAQHAIGGEPGSLGGWGLSYCLSEAEAKVNSSFEAVPPEGERYASFIDRSSKSMAARIKKWKTKSGARFLTGQNISRRAKWALLDVVIDAALEMNASWAEHARNHVMACV